MHGMRSERNSYDGFIDGIRERAASIRGIFDIKTIKGAVGRTLKANTWA